MTTIQMLGRYDYKDKGKSYQRSYYFHDADGERHWSCDVYGQCISGDRLIASLQGEELTQANRTKPKNVLGKLLDKVTFLNKALTVRVEPESQEAVDIRVLLAGMTLVEVHDITGVQT